MRMLICLSAFLLVWLPPSVLAAVAWTATTMGSGASPIGNGSGSPQSRIQSSANRLSSIRSGCSRNARVN